VLEPIVLTAALATALLGLAVLPFVVRRRSLRDDGRDTAAGHRGRVLRGLVLVGILIGIGGPYQYFSTRWAARDSKKADQQAQQLEASVLALMNSARSAFFANAVFISGSVPQSVRIDRANVGENATTTFSGVTIGRVHRCVVVRVGATGPPASRIEKGRC